jgi:hypothetical protein
LAPAALCLLLLLPLPLGAKIFGLTGGVADDDRVDLDWATETYGNAVGSIQCVNTFTRRLIYSTVGTGWLMRPPAALRHERFKILLTNLHVLYNRTKDNIIPGCRYLAASINRKAGAIDASTILPLFDGSFFSFGSGKRRRDYFKDLALVIVPAKTDTNGAYIARAELDWVALSPQKIVQNVNDGTFRKLDLVAYSARSNKSRIGKPRIRIARSVTVVAPQAGDLMYRENLLARKQGGGYLLSDGDAIDGASGGVLVATHADGRKLAVGVFKGFVVKGANFKGRDYVGPFDPKKRANLIVTIPKATAQRMAALVAKYMRRFSKKSNSRRAR